MFMQLGRLDAISIVGIHFGQLLLAMADDGGDEATKKTAVEILERSRQGLLQLGQGRSGSPVGGFFGPGVVGGGSCRDGSRRGDS